ncbi:hypothetical protein V5R04_01485 [Jonesiaceae bacterium BS-20]|uniref:MarR family transcriptional regulator n=1 Tax=Jonesiaceae bacterium BS-20 TaxID=3120821 RepID=A0AAU7DXA2_9MICO
MNEQAYAWAWKQADLSMEQSIVLLALAHFLDEGRIVGRMPMTELVRKSRQTQAEVLVRLQELKAKALISYDLNLIPDTLVYSLPVEFDEVTTGE